MTKVAMRLYIYSLIKYFKYAKTAKSNKLLEVTSKHFNSA